MNNINSKEMLTYVTSVLEQYGIHYINPDHFVKAKLNEEINLSDLERFLFDLCILHIFDYQINISQIDIKISQFEMRQVILAHLCQLQCPYLVKIRQNCVGLNFESSRQLLITIGWIMAVSDIFGNIQQKLFQKRLRQIESMRPDQFKNQKQKKQQIQFKKENNNISSLYKSIISRYNSISHLRQKKVKIIKKIENYLEKNSIKTSLDEILFSDKQFKKKKLKQTQKLVEFIEREKKCMRFRKIFWIWMETVINQDKKEIVKHQDYGFQSENQQTISKLKIDVDALIKFMEKTEQIQKMYEQNIQLFQQINEYWGSRKLSMTQKQKKEMKVEQNKIKSQVNNLLPDFYKGVNYMTNSFIGIQLHKIIDVNRQDESDKNSKKQEGIKSIENLKNICKQIIQNLEDWKFI